MSDNQAVAINWGRSGARAAAAAGSALVLLAILCTGAARAGDPDLLEEVLDAAAGHDQAGWAYTRTVKLSANAVGERKKVSVVETYDPSKPPGEQRERVEIRQEEGEITTKNDDDMDVDVDRAVYADLAEVEYQSAALVSDSADEALYRLDMNAGLPFRFGGARYGDSSLLDDVYGMLVVRKTGPGAPYVSEVRVLNDDSGGGLLADIEELNLSYRFAPSPDGATYLVQGLDLALQMEVLIFIDIDVRISTEYTAYSNVGEYEG